MKRTLCFVFYILVSKSLWGGTYTDEDFACIPQLDSLNAGQAKSLLIDGSISLGERTWRTVSITKDFNPVEFFAALSPEQSVKIEKIGETVRDPFFAIGGELLRLVKLRAVSKTDEVKKVTWRMICVSTNIDASFADNPLLPLISFESIEDLVAFLNTRKGPQLEILKTLFPKK